MSKDFSLDRPDIGDSTMAELFLERLREVDAHHPHFPVTPRNTACLLKGIADRPQAEAVAHTLITQLVQLGNLTISPDRVYAWGDWLPYYQLISPSPAADQQ